MAKINTANANARIAEITSKFPRNETGKILVTEKQFFEIVEKIMADSTKGFADALSKQTKKVAGRADYDARIATYRYDYGFFKFI